MSIAFINPTKTGCYVRVGEKLEAISKPQIAFDGKAQDGEKAEHTR